jgi:hypothetical protein
MAAPLGAKPLHFGAQVAEDIRHLAVAQFPHGFGQRGYLVAQGLVGHGASVDSDFLALSQAAGKRCR